MDEYAAWLAEQRSAEKAPDASTTAKKEERKQQRAEIAAEERWLEVQDELESLPEA